MSASVNRAAAGAAALLLAAGAAHGQQAATPDAASAWAEMRKCGALVNDDARHACTDEVLRRFDALAPPEARSTEHRRQFGLEVPKPRATPPAHHEEPAQAAPKTAKRPAPTPAAARDTDEQISVTLGEVVLRGDGKLTLTTTDGVVWRQVESDPVRPTPKSGQTMVIEKGILGGFMCKIGRWTAFRCTRRP